MPEFPSASSEQLPLPWRVDPARLARIVCCLVGHTVEDVERELILSSLDHYRGSRTDTAKVLGISIRGLRNKINLYAVQGIAVPPPGRREDTRTERAH
jgi:DNA-binding NtrC family response regulator